MVHLDDVRKREWYDYPQRGGGGMVRVYVVSIWTDFVDRRGNRWVRVRFEATSTGWGGEADISTFCRYASLDGTL